MLPNSDEVCPDFPSAADEHNMDGVVKSISLMEWLCESAERDEYCVFAGGLGEFSAILADFRCVFGGVSAYVGRSWGRAGGLHLFYSSPWADLRCVARHLSRDLFSLTALQVFRLPKAIFWISEEDFATLKLRTHESGPVFIVWSAHNFQVQSIPEHVRPNPV